MFGMRKMLKRNGPGTMLLVIFTSFIFVLTTFMPVAAAVSTGAVFHESLTDDLMIFYEPKLLARLAAVMREVAPEILLVQSPQDYMEDHQNSVRLAVSAAFVRGMPNCVTDPPRAPVDQPVTVYHSPAFWC